MQLNENEEKIIKDLFKKVTLYYKDYMSMPDDGDFPNQHCVDDIAASFRIICQIVESFLIGQIKQQFLILIIIIKQYTSELNRNFICGAIAISYRHTFFIQKLSSSISGEIHQINLRDNGFSAMGQLLVLSHWFRRISKIILGLDAPRTESLLTWETFIFLNPKRQKKYCNSYKTQTVNCIWQQLVIQYQQKFIDSFILKNYIQYSFFIQIYIFHISLLTKSFVLELQHQHILLEQKLVEAEAEIRNHIRIQQEIKVWGDSLQDEIISLQQDLKRQKVKVLTLERELSLQKNYKNACTSQERLTTETTQDRQDKMLSLLSSQKSRQIQGQGYKKKNIKLQYFEDKQNKSFTQLAQQFLNSSLSKTLRSGIVTQKKKKAPTKQCKTNQVNLKIKNQRCHSQQERAKTLNDQSFYY